MSNSTTRRRKTDSLVSRLATSRKRTRLYWKTPLRVVARYGFCWPSILARPDERFVFVIGSPRSGTTFTASSLGGVEGFADLGEVNRLKAAVPLLTHDVARGQQELASRKIRAMLRNTQRLSLVADRRPIEQTPECSFLVREIARAFPQARFIHLVRDGRDVAASLVETGWLASSLGRTKQVPTDDAGLLLGNHSRFWVEHGREQEFAQASEARRAAWAWRRYVRAAQAGLAELPADRSLTIRYERLVQEPAKVADNIAGFLQSTDRLQDFVTSLSNAHSRSVGRFASSLNRAQQADILDEGSDLLTELGYLSASPR